MADDADPVGGRAWLRSRVAGLSLTWVGAAYLAAVAVGAGVVLFDGRGSHAIPPHVAQIWSESIGNLDIAPIYPPREDFYLGDVYATITQTPAGFETYRGKAIRVGHVDVKDAVKTSCRYAAEICGADGASPNDHIVGFPAFKIASGANVSLEGSWGGASATGSSNDNRQDELTIQKATTRDADASDVLKAVTKYCGADKATENCSDYVARYLLYASFTQERGILEFHNIDTYCQWHIELYVATRLYLTTKIHHEYRAVRGVEAKITATKSGDGQKRAALSAGQSEDSEVGGPDDNFDRPVAFGWQFLLVHPYQNKEIPKCPELSPSSSR